MPKLSWQQWLRLWLSQQRRLLILSAASLLAVLLMIISNSSLLTLVPESPGISLPLLTLAQLGMAGLVVALVLIAFD